MFVISPQLSTEGCTLNVCLFAKINATNLNTFIGKNVDVVTGLHQG